MSFRRFPALIAGGLLLAATFLAVVALSCGGTEASKLEAGDCIEKLDLKPGQEFERLPTVECSKPHQAEVLAVIELEEGDFPGALALGNEAETRCPEGWTNYFYPPNEGAWKRFRKLICVEDLIITKLQSANLTLNGLPAGFDLVGERLSGSQYVDGGSSIPVGSPIIRGCTDPAGHERVFSSKSAATGLYTVDSYVFHFPSEEAAAACIETATQLVSDPAFLEQQAAEVDQSGQLVLDPLEEYPAVGVAFNEHNFTASARLRDVDVSVVATSWQNGTEIGLLILYFLGEADDDGVADLTQRLSDSVQGAFGE